MQADTYIVVWGLSIFLFFYLSENLFLTISRHVNTTVPLHIFIESKAEAAVLNIKLSLALKPAVTSEYGMK